MPERKSIADLQEGECFVNECQTLGHTRQLIKLGHVFVRQSIWWIEVYYTYPQHPNELHKTEYGPDWPVLVYPETTINNYFNIKN